MTFKEIRERLANRDVIREKQEIEERAEAEREAQAERAKRQAEREQQQQAQKKETTTTAAADTSSEVHKKVKEKFLKDTSKVIVKVLGESFNNGKIKSKEDFRHLAKKVLEF